MKSGAVQELGVRYVKIPHTEAIGSDFRKSGSVVMFTLSGYHSAIGGSSCEGVSNS